MSEHSYRRLDHVVLAARDLEGLAGVFRRLGFVVGARNRHPWGTLNHIVQLDGSFLELIGLDSGFKLAPDHDPHNFSFCGFVADYLAQREGPALLALTSDNAEADARAFRVMGIGDFEPFHFERRARRPDGSTVEVAFTLAFARSLLLSRTGFFSCQHHFPQNFWDPAFRAHANGAWRLDGVVLVAENPADHGEFLSHLTGVREYSARSTGISFELGEGPAQRLDVMTPLAFDHWFGSERRPQSAALPAIAACILSADRAALLGALDGARIAYEIRDDLVVISPDVCFGTTLAFRAA